MSLTSHNIYPIAKRHALSVVTMGSHAKIVRICTYMLDDIPNRLHWVRELEVGFDDISAEMRRHLLQSYVKSELYDTAARLLVLSSKTPSISDRSKSYTRESNAVFAIQREMLREMRSSPVELSLWIPSPSYLFSIQHIRTIRHLALSELNMDNEEYPNDAEASQLPSSWPTVSSLTLNRCRLSMSEAVQAFPNVRELRVECPFDSNSTSSVCWPHMDYVGGPIELFEQWSFNCYVHHLSITSALYLDSAYDVTVLNTHSHDGHLPIIPTLDKLEQQVHVLIEHIHSLQYVSIQYTTSRALDAGWWRIVRSGEERTVERISQYDAEQIRAKINARDLDPAFFIEA
ncbi:predicted protein [Postia placenta Mad-698-R]|nr:predicted protein [Postia placenta Mad-698-R]